jgi:hypothetical protein
MVCVTALSFSCLSSPQDDKPAAGDGLSTLRHSLALLATRSQDAKVYSWSGDVEIAAQQNAGPMVGMGHSKVQLAVAEDGKSLVKVQSDFGDEYWLISDGKKRWSCLPGKKQYSEEEAASVSQDSDDDDDDQQPDRGADAPPTEQMAWQAIPKIAKILKNAQSLSSAKTATLKLAEGKVTWPVIEIQEKPDEDGTVTVAQLVMAPDRPVVGRFTWVNTAKRTRAEWLCG